MLITQSVKALTGGVSQQSETERSPNQMGEQINCINSLVSGLRTRQATWFNALLQTEGSENLTNAHKHEVNRDANEKYIMFFNPEGVSVFDTKTGNKYPVEAQAGALNYLQIMNDDKPNEAFRTITSADTTYLLNRSQTVFRELRDKGAVTDPEDTTRLLYKVSALTGDRDKGEYIFSLNGFYVYSDATEGVTQAVGRLAGLLDSQTGDDFAMSTVGNLLYLDMPKAATTPEIIDTSYAIIERRQGRNELEEYEVPQICLTVTEQEKGIPLDDLGGSYLVHITQADYSVTYTIRIGDHRLTYTTPEATTERARAGLSIKELHSQLASKVNNVAPDEIQAIASDGFIHIVLTSQLAVTVADDLNNFSMKVIGETTQLFSDLPREAPEGYRTKITGELGDDSLGYWVEYKKDKSAWIESRHPTEVHGLDKTTMPHILVRRNKTEYVDDTNLLGIYFTLTQGEWSDRLVGDDDSTPFPSFVSEWDNVNNIPLNPRSINAMVFHRNRLVFSSDEHITMSEAALFNNFFRTTAEAIKDSDPIDVGVLSTEINPIEAMLSAQNELILYGSKRQYSLRSGDILSANSVYADPLSSYPVDGLAAPLFAGDMVFFLVKRNGYNAVFISAINEQRNAATEITSHVPTYIKGKPTCMTVSTTENRLFVQTDDDPKVVYVYDYKIQNNQNIHSAWGKWVFKDDVVSLHVEDSLLNLVTRTGDTFYSEVMSLDSDYGKSQYGYSLAMDRLREFDESIEEDEEVLTLPTGKLRGKPIDMSFTISPIFLRDKDNSAIIDGRLQVKKVSMSVKDTEGFNIEVSRNRRAEGNNDYKTRYVGQTNLGLGSPILLSKLFSTQINGDVKYTTLTVTANSKFTCSFQRLLWEGRYTRRRRQV
jgi:hypothetical protein